MLNALLKHQKSKYIVPVHGNKYSAYDLEISVCQTLKNFHIGKMNCIFSLADGKQEIVIFLQEVTANIAESVQVEIINKIRNVLQKEYGITLHGVVLVKEHSLPTTASGKLQRKRCEQQFLEQHLQILRKEFKKPATNHTSQIHSQKINAGKIHCGDIAIIGLSCLFPGADNVDAFWQNLLQGKNGITEVSNERWNWKIHGHARWGGFVDHIKCFDADFFNIPTREAELIDPQQRILLQQVWLAIEDAGYTTTMLAQQKAGVFVGASSSEYASLVREKALEDVYAISGLANSMLANRISHLLNFTGPSEVIDTACSSSLVAIHRAVQAIQQGDCQLAIAGGVNALLTPDGYKATYNAGLLSADGKCKTFDKAANGYVRAEGAAAVVLKPLDQAQQDGDHIYGVIKATMVNHSGYSGSVMTPKMDAQTDLLIAAYRKANLAVDSIGYIETHGIGTPLADHVEVNALKKAFSILQREQGKNLHQQSCGLGSVKTQIGHMESAAGIASVIKVLLSLKYNIMPMNLQFEEINPDIELADSPFYILHQNQSWQSKIKAHKKVPRCAGVSSFGFGGTNAHLIIQEFLRRQHPSIGSYDTTSNSVVITLSAKTELALKQKINAFYGWLVKQKQPLLTAISYTLNVGRHHFAHRCAMVVHSIEELQTTLRQVQLEHQPENFVTSMRTKKPYNNHLNKLIYNELFSTITKELEAIASMDKIERYNKLLVLAALYTEGYDMSWENLYKHSEKKRIPLPGYSFAKTPYWIIPNEFLSPITLGETKTGSVHSRIKPYYLLTISAKQPQNAKQKIIELSHWLESNDSNISLEKLSSMLNFKEHFPIKFAFIVSSKKELLQILKLYLQNQQTENIVTNINKQFTDDSAAFNDIYKSTIKSLFNKELSLSHYKAQLFILADLYIKNYPIDWRQFYAENSSEQKEGSGELAVINVGMAENG